MAEPDAWLDGLVAQQTAPLSTREFLKALRALSSRYVMRRAGLTDRSPLDTTAKRAAFAGFYAPLHYLTVRAVVAALGAAQTPVGEIADLGCGTGLSGIAWAEAFSVPPRIQGIDRDGWALSEARRAWQVRGIDGRPRRVDLITAAQSLTTRPARSAKGDLAVLAAWSVNELGGPARNSLLELLVRLAGTGATILIIEPVARRISPWWDEAVAAFGPRARADDWRFEMALPPRLAALDEAAGFEREGLTARSLYVA